MPRDATPRRNRLAGETSPYLRQHAGQPVGWFPWGEEAFAEARAAGKPIFLSIGYSTCHWCHVMARESFENPEIAALLDEHFVPIKVDREERPDIDRMYMTFVQAAAGHGGWPMSVWLAPDLRPFYGGTYFPPEDAWGRPGFATVLRALARSWRENRPRVLEQAARSIDALRSIAACTAAAGPGTPLGPEPARHAFALLRDAFDPVAGGFGSAPKFPQPCQIEFLWRWHALARERGDAEGAATAATLAGTTLRHIAAGGIHDHLGGGFHRYSVDASWHVPHFEKMLYDQGQLACVLLDGFLVCGEAAFAEAARDTLDYVRRDLTGAEGAFFSAEDADSARDTADGAHREGAFYVWTAGEIRAVLGPERARVFAVHYGIEDGGNVPEGSDPHGELAGANVPIRRRSIEETAAAVALEPSETAALLAACRAALFEARQRRPRPHRDEKILAAWNGLAISAFARAARVFDDPAWARLAARAAGFLHQRMWQPSTGTLARSFCAGRIGPEGFAEDYAFLAHGLIDLYEATFDLAWLRWAAELQARLDASFRDSDGSYFSSDGRDPSVLVRMKEHHDGAEPSPSSAAARNLLRLGRLFGDAGLVAQAEATMGAFSGTWGRDPSALPCMLSALVDTLLPPRHVVIAGRRGSPDFEALAREVHRRFLPGLSVLAVDDGEDRTWLAGRAPWLRDMRPVGGRAAAHVCRDFTCRLPIVEPQELGVALDDGA
jgi:hypothetical protein